MEKNSVLRFEFQVKHVPRNENRTENAKDKNSIQGKRKFQEIQGDYDFDNGGWINRLKGEQPPKNLVHLKISDT